MIRTYDGCLVEIYQPRYCAPIEYFLNLENALSSSSGRVRLTGQSSILPLERILLNEESTTLLGVSKYYEVLGQSCFCPSKYPINCVEQIRKNYWVAEDINEVKNG